MADKMNIRFRIKAIDDFSKNMDKLERKLNSIKRASNGIDDIQANVTANADTATAEANLERYHNKLKEVRNLGAVVSAMHIDPEVDFDDNAHATMARMSRVERHGKKISPIIIALKYVEKGFNAWRKDMDRVADISRDMGEIVRGQLVGAFAALSPVAAVGIAQTAGSLSGLASMIGVTFGGIMGLGTAFAMAGAGAGAFAAVATTNLGKVFEVSKDVARLQEKLERTDDLEKRKKIQEEIARIQGTLNSNQERALKSLDSMKSTWSEIAGSLETGTVDAFSKAMQNLEEILLYARPTFEASVEAANELMDALSRNLESDDVKAFFNFMNKTAGPMFETLGKAIGNFTVGLMNVLRAFGPLSVEMANGFLNMSESFRKWTDSLSESDKFQSFVDFVRTNGPKMLDIFGSLFLGIIDLVAAFAPVNQDFIDGLQNMMNKFQEWASSLGENKQFQEFIDYIQRNGPQFMSFLGELITFLTNLGIAFGQVGESIMPTVTNLFEFLNGLMENNRWLARLVPWLVIMGGLFNMLAPIVAVLIRVIRNWWPQLKQVWTWLTKLGPKITAFWNVIKSIIPWIMRIGRVLLTGMISPIGLVIAAVALAAYFVWKYWDEIKAFTMSLVETVAEWFARMYVKVTGWIDTLVATAKTLWTMFKEDVIGKALEIYNGANEKFKQIKEAVIKWITQAVAKVVTKLREMKESFDEKIEKAKSIVEKGLEFIKGLFDIDLSESGRALIQGFLDGVSGMFGSIRRKIGEAAELVRSYWPFSPAKRGPLSDIHRMDFAGPIMDSMKRGEGTIKRGLNNLVQVPDINTGDMNRRNQIYRAESRDLYAHRDEEARRSNELLKGIHKELRNQKQMIIELDHRAVGVAVEPHVTNMQNRNQQRKKRFKG